jgi:Fe-Mn family superoxide dismutase
MIGSKSLLRRAFNTAAKPLTATLKPLPYELGALEPVISGHLMEFHYGKHHRTYVNNLNALSEKSAEALTSGDIKKYIELSHLVKFNGGGHLNHEFFWDSLAPPNAGGGAIPDAGSDLRTLIESEWGTIEDFQNHFNASSAVVQGSGWGWLAYNKHSGLLEYRATKNQDTLADISNSLIPLMTIDVWEHAYYLDYKNQRPSFLKEMWGIMNWPKVEERLAAAKLHAVQPK